MAREAVTICTKEGSTIVKLSLARHELIFIYLFRYLQITEAIKMAPAAKASSSRVFIALEIGDQDEAARQEQGYKVAQDFLKSVGSQVGGAMCSNYGSLASLSFLS